MASSLGPVLLTTVSATRGSALEISHEALFQGTAITVLEVPIYPQNENMTACVSP